MKTEVHEITAKKAREFLDKNPVFERGAEGTNRPVNWRKVNQYAYAMLNGDWRLTHQGIGFSLSGELKDGQHRLYAILQAAEEGAIFGETILPAKPSIKIKMQVTFGLDEDVFDVLDSGLQRSASHVLQIAGYTNAGLLAPSARLLNVFDLYEYKYWQQIRTTNHEVLQIIRRTGLDEYAYIAAELRGIGIIGPSAVVGYYAANRAYPTGPHDDFFDGLITGANMSRDDPRLVLREYYLKSKATSIRARRDASVHLAMYIKGWNDFATGKRRAAISWRSTEPFPRPIEK